MSKFAVKNLMDIEAMEAAPGMEMRFSRKYLDSEQLGVTRLEYAPGFSSRSGHSHKVQEEAYVVVEGSGTAKLDDERVELKEWDVIRVAPEVVRNFDAGPDGLVLIALGGPKPEEGDGVMAMDYWDES